MTTIENNASPTLLQRIASAEDFIESAGGVKLNKYDLGPWSASKLKMAEKCPLQFYLQYVVKVKPDAGEEQDTDLADAGTIAHKILEYVVLGHEVSEAFRLAKIDHCEVVDNKPGNANVTQELWDEKVLNIEASVIAFKERLEKFEQNNNVKKKFTELRLGVTKDWTPTTFFAKNVYFRGIVDLILLMDNGEGFLPDAIILDHKNGGGDFSNTTKNYQQQLDIYKPLIHFGLQKLSGAQAGINFVRAQKLLMDDYVDARDIEDKLRGRLEWLLSAAVERIVELGYFKHVAGSACTYCAFKGPCKNGELKEMEKGTKKWFQIKKIEDDKNGQ